MMKKMIRPLDGAQRKLVEENIDFAMNIGLKFAGLGASVGLAVEDLQQEACYGLCVAAGRYRASPALTDTSDVQGDGEAAFTTYAYDWCMKYVMLAIDGEHDGVTDGVDNAEDVAETVDESSMERMERMERVDSLLGRLSEKEREVVCLVYGITYRQGASGQKPMGLSEVALALHLPLMRVRQIYQMGMEKLRN